MTLRHLRIFAEVYRARSVTAAARALHMTQPAVTRAVQELESHYGVRLFERIRRRISPTDSGERLYARAVHVLDSFDRMEAELSDWGEQGVVRVGATITLGGTLLPALAEQFARENPRIGVRVTVANGDAVAAGLVENRLDVGLLEGGVPSDELHSEAIGSDRLCLVLPASHPLAARDRVTVRELARLPLLVREQGSTARTLLEQTLDSEGLAFDPVWESASTEAILQAVAHGLGAAVLPEQVAAASVRDGLVCTRRVSDALFERRRILVWHRDKYLTQAMRRFIELCRRQARSGGAGL